MPAYATAPALFFVACLMLRELTELDWDETTEVIPAAVTALAMPFTYSIANGLAFGFITYAVLKLFTGQAKQVHWMVWLIGGVFLFCKYGVPLLIERGGGVILNTASIAALRGGADAHAYTATKGAVLALTRAVAVTYGPKGIRANTLCPGVIDTEMIHEALIERDDVRTVLAKNTPLRRIGTRAGAIRPTLPSVSA